MPYFVFRMYVTGMQHKEIQCLSLETNVHGFLACSYYRVLNKVVATMRQSHWHTGKSAQFSQRSNLHAA